MSQTKTAQILAETQAGFRLGRSCPRLRLAGGNLTVTALRLILQP